jgi:hypothetical protein
MFFFINGENQTITYGKQSINSTESIVGTWKLTMEGYDDNSNSKLDDEERKSGMKNSTPQALHDYKMQFNANGTCKIEGRYNGTYKVKEEGGEKILLVDLEPGKGLNGKQLPASHYKYYIKSMTSSELLLLAEVSGVAIIFRQFKKA